MDSPDQLTCPGCTKRFAHDRSKSRFQCPHCGQVCSTQRRVSTDMSLKMMSVVIPANVGPGQQFAVMVAGQRLGLTCPPGKRSGDTMQFSYNMPQQQQPPQQPVAPQQPPQQAATKMMSVMVPQGVGPGQQFAVMVGGQRMALTCPAGKRAGDSMQFRVADPGAAAAAAAPPRPKPNVSPIRGRGFSAIDAGGGGGGGGYLPPVDGAGGGQPAAYPGAYMPPGAAASAPPMGGAGRLQPARSAVLPAPVVRPPPAAAAAAGRGGGGGGGGCVLTTFEDCQEAMNVARKAGNKKEVMRLMRLRNKLPRRGAAGAAPAAACAPADPLQDLKSAETEIRLLAALQSLMNIEQGRPAAVPFEWKELRTIATEKGKRLGKDVWTPRVAGNYGKLIGIHFKNYPNTRG